MRLFAVATISAALASGLVGCGDSDHPLETAGEAGFTDGGSAGNVALGGAGHSGLGRAGAGHAGSAATGGSDDGSAGEGIAGSEISGGGGVIAGVGGTMSGAGGVSSGAGGTMSGAGGVSSGAGGTMSGAGGVSSGAGGTMSGAGGVSSGAGGTMSGAGGVSSGAGGTMSGAGGVSSGSGGTMSGAGGSSSGTAGVMSGAGGSISGAGGAAPSVPAAATEFFAQVLNPTSISIRWNDNATDETGYYVYWSPTGIKPAFPNATITGNESVSTMSTIAEGLTTGIPYSFWIEAYNAIGASSALKGNATAGLVPQLTGLRLDYANTATRLTLIWDDAVDETGYHVYLATSQPQPATPLHALPANTVSYTFPSGEITPYTVYRVWISAYNALGDGPPESTFGVVGTPPAAPTSLSIKVNIPSFTITGSWATGSSNTTRFNVYWSADTSQFGGPQAPAVVQSAVDADTHSSTLNQVIGDQYYTLWVEAANPVGTSYAAKTVATTKTSDLSWRELWLDQNTQDIHLAVDDTFQFISDGDPQTELNVYQSSTSWAYTMGTPTALGPSTSVLWNATALDIDTSRPHYFWAEAKRPEGTLLSMQVLSPGVEVAHLVATPSQNSVSLSWDMAPGSQSYLIYWSTGYYDDAILSGTTASNSATVNGLLPGTHYNFYVRSVQAAIGGGGFIGEPVEVGANTTGP